MAPPEATPVSVSVVRCGHCEALAAGPRQLCGTCHRAALAPLEVPGSGRLASWTVIRRPPLRFQEHAPYAVCVVDLECGVRVTGRLQGFEDEPAPGASVRCVARDADVATFSKEA